MQHGDKTMKNKISKKSLKIKENDFQFQTYQLDEVKDDGDDWCLRVDGSALLTCPKIKGFVPVAGMIAKFYGKGFGYTVRGVEINGNIMYYRTPEEEEERHKKWCDDKDERDKKNFKKMNKKLDEYYNKLPDLFKQRIDKFRNNNPDFRWKYESYEMFCCNEAVKIANALKSIEEIKKWKDLSFEEQKKLVDIDEGHSGNTFGCSVNLACWYLSSCPENVVRQYGALAPLVGSKEYGCVPRDTNLDCDVK